MKSVKNKNFVLFRSVCAFGILISIYSAQSNAYNATYSEKTCTCHFGYEQSMNLWGYAVTGTYNVKYTNTGDVGWAEGYTENITTTLTEPSFVPTYETAINLCGLSINSLKASGQCSAKSLAPASSAVNISEVGERTKYFTLSAREQQEWNYLNESEQRRFEFAIVMAQIDSDNHLIDSDSRLYRAIADIYAKHSIEDRDLLKKLLRKVKMGRRGRY